MSSLLSGLNESDHSADHGWSESNRFNASVTELQSPTTYRSPQHYQYNSHHHQQQQQQQHIQQQQEQQHIQQQHQHQQQIHQQQHQAQQQEVQQQHQYQVQQVQQQLQQQHYGGQVQLQYNKSPPRQQHTTFLHHLLTQKHLTQNTSNQEDVVKEEVELIQEEPPTDVAPSTLQQSISGVEYVASYRTPTQSTAALRYLMSNTPNQQRVFSVESGTPTQQNLVALGSEQNANQSVQYIIYTQSASQSQNNTVGSPNEQDVEASQPNPEILNSVNSVNSNQKFEFENVSGETIQLQTPQAQVRTPAGHFVIAQGGVKKFYPQVNNNRTANTQMFVTQSPRTSHTAQVRTLSHSVGAGTGAKIPASRSSPSCSSPQVYSLLTAQNSHHNVHGPGSGNVLSSNFRGRGRGRGQNRGRGRGRGKLKMESSYIQTGQNHMVNSNSKIQPQVVTVPVGSQELINQNVNSQQNVNHWANQNAQSIQQSSHTHNQLSNQVTASSNSQFQLGNQMCGLNQTHINSSNQVAGSNMDVVHVSEGSNVGRCVESLNAANVEVEGASGLEENMIYMVRNAEGKERMMVWRGAQFWEYTGETITEPNQGSQIGGGRGRGLRGNATGMHMAPGRETKKTYSRKKPQIQSVLPNPYDAHVVNSQHRNSLTAQIARRPNAVIHSKQESVEVVDITSPVKSPPKSASEQEAGGDASSKLNGPCGSEEATDSKSGETGAGEGKAPPDSTGAVVERLRKEAKEESDQEDKSNPTGDNIACCQYCGFSSFNLKKCERCNRPFNEKTKVYPNPNKRKNPTDSTARLMDKRKFYGEKMAEQNAVYKEIIKAANTGEKLTTKVQSPGILRRGRKVRCSTQHVNTRVAKVPVVTEPVMISSDEEEPEAQGSRTQSRAPTPAQEDSSTKEVNVVSSQGTEDAERQDRSPSPIFPHVPTPKRTYGAGSRREKMENPHGEPVKRSKSPEIEVTLPAKSVRVGSFRGVPIEPVLLSYDGLHFYIEGLNGSHKFVIYPNEIQQCLMHFDPGTSYMFLLTSPGCGARTRRDLGIPPVKNPGDPEPDPYFDPQSKDMTHQLITVTLSAFDVQLKQDFTAILDKFRKEHAGNKSEDNSYFMELSGPEAQEVYRQSTLTKPVQPKPAKECESASQLADHAYSMSEEDNRSRSPSPKIGFAGPIIKLLTYPPPPATGGITITNEDLYCLTEGEFLNDVIIDFYLKYLYRDKLSDADRKRTHIFSSFFYKRLTSRGVKGHAIEDDPNLTPAAKRHARVKTWTRQVDLFKKDFIIIPINEHSHWFLAIICFPGQGTNHFCPFIPRPKMEQADEAPSPQTGVGQQEDIEDPLAAETDMEQDPGAEETTGEATEKEVPMEMGDTQPTTEAAPVPVPKPTMYKGREVRGKAITPGEAKNMAPLTFSVGMKQPCILIFDSLAGPSRSRIVTTLKEYLQVEWNIKKKEPCELMKMRGSAPKVPQQTNYSDCGVYILQYVESFFDDPIQDYAVPMKGLQDWFTDDRVRLKRDEIRELVMTLKELHDVKNGTVSITNKDIEIGNS